MKVGEPLGPSVPEDGTQSQLLLQNILNHAVKLNAPVKFIVENGEGKWCVHYQTLLDASVAKANGVSYEPFAYEENEGEKPNGAVALFLRSYPESEHGILSKIHFPEIKDLIIDTTKRLGSDFDQEVTKDGEAVSA